MTQNFKLYYTYLLQILETLMADQMDQLLGPIVAHRPSKARISLTTVVPDLGISVIFNLPRQPQVWLILIRHLVW